MVLTAEDDEHEINLGATLCNGKFAKPQHIRPLYPSRYHVVPTTSHLIFIQNFIICARDLITILLTL